MLEGALGGHVQNNFGLNMSRATMVKQLQVFACDDQRSIVLVEVHVIALARGWDEPL